MSFEALLEDLEQLQKAKPPAKEDDDKAIAQAAGGDVDEDGTPDGADDLPELDDDDDEDEDEDDGEGDMADEDKKGQGKLAKAISLIDEGGDPVEAYDATEIVEDLQQRLAKAEANNQRLLDAMARQTQVLKSFGSRLGALENHGQPRKSVLSIHEKPSAVAPADAPTPQDILAKAEAAFTAGRLNAIQVSTIENAVGHGWPVPDHLTALLK